MLQVIVFFMVLAVLYAFIDGVLWSILVLPFKLFGLFVNSFKVLGGILGVLLVLGGLGYLLLAT